MNGVLWDYFVVFHREFDNKMSRREIHILRDIF